MNIENLPEGLIELAKAKLKESKDVAANNKPEEIVINPVIDSPHSVQSQ